MVAGWPLVSGGTMIGLDSAVFFYPMYSFLGERLAAGDIPGWNPHQFSGVPFAADPQSGWMYWPAMLLFTFLPLEAAAEGYMLLHLLGAGVATYALARVLGMNSIGALLAAMAYEFNSFVYERNVCCFAYTGVLLWLPLLLLSAETALRSRRWIARAFWWGVGGLALSQILSAWLGQGFYYAVLALGGYVAYRTLVAPPTGGQPILARLGTLAVHGTALLLWGIALSAAGLLPRIEYNRLSNLASGYPGTQAAVHSGWSLSEWGSILGYGGTYYVGSVAVTLAFLAPFLARARFATPYWLVLCGSALVLSGQGPTPLHSLLYPLPGFARLHPHDPERVMVVFYLGAALLAGASVSMLPRLGRRTAASALIPFMLALVALGVGLALPEFATPPAILYALAAAVLFLVAGSLATRQRQVALVLLTLVLFTDLYGAGQTVARRGPGGFQKVDISAYYQPGAAAEFLAGTGKEVPERHFGYEPLLRLPGEPANSPAIKTEWLDLLYRYQFADRRPARILVNNRATVLGLHDIQGYNPVHISRYDDLVTAINGHPQEYRSSYVLEEGLSSPLLGLLAARYAVLLAGTPSATSTIPALGSGYTTVYRDGEVEVLERDDVLPRAWLVHEARQVRPGEAIEQLSAGKSDPRRVALLEVSPPVLSRPRNPADDSTRITSYAPDHLVVRTDAEAPGLLMLGEVYYPAWKAYVDGRSVPLYLANHAFRAVQVPAGTHTVELRYESSTLRLGLAISGAAYALLAGLAIAALVRRRHFAPTRTEV